MRCRLLSPRNDAMRLHIVVHDHVLCQAQKSIRNVPRKAGGLSSISGDVFPEFAVVIVDWEEGILKGAGGGR